MPQISTPNPTPSKPGEETLTFHGAGHTVTGTRHRVNQDRFHVDNRRGLFILADGMGGCRAGERASRMAVDLLAYHHNLMDLDHADRDAVCKAISQAFLDVDQEIHSAANLDAQLFGMGTTAVLVLVAQHRLFVGNLGDSRAYLLRDGDLQRYTVDHNMAQTLVNLGVISRNDAREHQWRHVLWKYLGIGKLKDGPEVNVVRLEPGDRVVLVTDGITETLSDRDLSTILEMHGDTGAAAEAIVRSAVTRGTHDDATSVVLDIG